MHPSQGIIRFVAYWCVHLFEYSCTTAMLMHSLAYIYFFLINAPFTIFSLCRFWTLVSPEQLTKLSWWHPTLLLGTTEHLKSLWEWSMQRTVCTRYGSSWYIHLFLVWFVILHNFIYWNEERGISFNISVSVLRFPVVSGISHKEKQLWLLSWWTLWKLSLL